MKVRLLNLQLAFLAVCLSMGFLAQPVLAVEPVPGKEGGQDLFKKTSEEIYSPNVIAAEGVESYTALIINGILTVVGTFFLLMTIYGGLLWMIARGDEAKATKARDTIVMAAIGLTVVLASYALTTFIIGRLAT